MVVDGETQIVFSFQVIEHRRRRDIQRHGACAEAEHGIVFRRENAVLMRNVEEREALRQRVGANHAAFAAD